METILGLGWEAAAFVVAMLFVVRPIAIFTATIGTGLTWQERLLSAWIAPRGIVAVAVAGLFGATLVEQGVADGEKMIAYTFAVVACTIVLHGFSLPILARLLNLRSSATPGILLVGGSNWSTAFAEKLQALDIPVLIADDNWNHLRPARAKNLPTFFGDVLSEHAHHEINMNTWASVITASDNDAYNALVCTEFGPEIGRSNVFQIGNRGGENHKRELHFTLGGRPLTKPGFEFSELNDNLRDGWSFNATTLTEEFTFDNFLKSREENSTILFWYKPGGNYVFSSLNPNTKPTTGCVILSFSPQPSQGGPTELMQSTDQNQ